MNGCVDCDLYFVFILFLTTFFLLKNGETALYKAASNGFEQTVKILIEHGSNVNIGDKVFILFFFLILFLIFFLTTFFLLKYGWTALHIAASKGFEQIVKILIEYRSNINIGDKVFILFFFFL